MTEPSPGHIDKEALDRPFHCLCFNVRRTARALTQAFDAALAPAGLTVSQFTVLTMIAHMAPIARHRLAAGLGMDRTTLTRALAPLVRDGLVCTVEGEDRRERRMALTEAGEVRRKAALPHWRRAQGRVADMFGPAESADLLRALGRLRSTLGSD